MHVRRLIAPLVLAHALWATAALGEITRGSLQIQGIALEVDTPAVTTGIDIPTTIQTKFAGKTNEASPAVEGLLAVGELTGPGLDTPIQLTTTPGYRFQIPGFAREGIYYLQNIRLMKGNELVAPAIPPTAAITVADVLQTSVKVRQLTPEELRSRGIVVDGRNYDVYEYSFTFLIDGKSVEIPFPVVIDPRTHEVTPIKKETPFNIPQVKDVRPPRWSPPEVVLFDLPAEEEAGDFEQVQEPKEKEKRGGRPRIPAAIVIPNSFAVLHQFFAVILTVSNGAPSGSTARLDDIRATIKIPSALRAVKSNPSVPFGQPVPIVDPTTGVTFLVAQAKGEAEWDLEGLKPGTHTVDIEVRATLREVGQEDVPLKATPRASIVVHDPRFNLTFSHPDVVRKGIDYATYSFITNMSGNQQTLRVRNGLPSCDQVSGANVCRLSGAETDELTLAPGEMKIVEYRLRPGVTGQVFATAGTVDTDNIAAAVQLHMGVSESGIPLSPTTLLMPHYAQYVAPDLVDRNLELLGLGYSIATAPVNQVTAKFPRIIKSDVFYRAVEIARAGQKIFISNGEAAAKLEAIAGLSLDLLGNSVDLTEWDELRRREKSGRTAGASVIRELNAVGMTGRSGIGEFVDLFAAATSYRAPYVFALLHGPAVSGNARPYALALRGASGRRADIPNEATANWVRDLAFADISQFDVPSLGRTGELAMVGRWTEDLDLVITPAVSGALSLEIVFPGATDGSAMRARLDLNGTAGEVLRVPLTRGATTLNALLPNGGFNATATASQVALAPLHITGARQDLYLDPEGHKVSVLFSRPVALQDGADLRAKFAGRITFNRDGVVYNGDRVIFAAALQDGARIANLSFDHILTTNASYAITVSPLLDAMTRTEVAFANPLQPKIDNDRPAGIVYGKFLKGDNTPIPLAEVRMYTGHWQGCKVGLLDDEPPIDCNPFKEAPQYAKSEGDGSFLFEYIPRDPIGDSQLTGGYRLIGVNSEGRFTIVDGTVRLPGRVHFVNLQLLGRGAAEGTARYDNGEKVVGGAVFVGSTMFNVGRSTKTDANGFFHVEDLPVGPITFAVTDAAGNIAYASGEIATPGQLISRELVIYRKPFPGTGTVYGVVRRSDTNGPVAGARVGVFSQGFGLSEAFSDSEGRFEFRKVPAGFVTVLAAEYAVARDSAAIDFDLRPDEVREANITLGVQSTTQAAATLNGNVIRENPLFPGDPTKYERVPGAIVKLGKRATITADGEGRFVFEGLPLTFSNGGELSAYDPVTKRVGSAAIPTLTEAGPNNITIFIPANSFGTGTIRVRLISANGSPATGFRVIEPGFPPTPLRAIGGGLYEYSNAPVGSNVDIWAVQGPSEYGDQHANTTVALQFPGQVASATMRLPGQGTVRVKIRGDFDVIGDVDLSYSVWDDAEQSLQPKFPPRTQSTSENGIAGYATFLKVPALQNYGVSSSHPSYGYSSQGGTLGYDGDLATHVMQMNKLATIRGAVYAIDGRTPIAGAEVRLDDGRRDTGINFTQPDGTFAFHDVPAGIGFSITANATQSGIYRTGVAYGKTPDIGGPVNDVAVILRRRGNVEGRVVYIGYQRFDPDNPANNIADPTPNDLSDNAPVPLARLWMRELDFPNRSFGTDQNPLMADVTGRFAINNVFVGALRAKAWDSGNQELQGDWSGSLAEEGQTIQAYVGIGSGGTGSIQVTIADPNQLNQGVTNAEVRLHIAGLSEPLFDLTSSDGNGVGRFHQVPVGNYVIRAYSKALGKSGASASFAVQRDQVSDLRVLLEFSGEVDGTLTDPESSPPGRGIPGAAVTLRGTGYESRASTTLTGAFSFDGIREGLFTLEAKDTETNRRARASRSLSAADPHPIVNLELERTETLHLGVYLPDDTGANSGILAGPVNVDVVQRNGDFFRSMQGNPIVMSKLFVAESYQIGIKEIGGERRELGFNGSFPKGTSADPIKLVYPAYGNVEVTVMQAGSPASDARVTVSAGSQGATMVTDATGKVIAHRMPLGNVSAQAVSLDKGFSGSANAVLARQSVPARMTIELGAYAGVTGLVEAEAGGPSVGTRVVATFAGRALEMLTTSDGRYTFQGIPTQAGGTLVSLTYIGDDDVTVGAVQSVTLQSDAAMKVIPVPTVRLDATPPQVVSITPLDGAANVSPDTTITIVFSERIRVEQINNNNLQLVAVDGTGQVIAAFDAPVVGTNGTFIITMRPPPPSGGQRFPLKSNTLYRVIISGAIQDLTGHRLPAPRGTTFTTSDYVEPRVIKVLPATNTPVPEQVTFQFHFNEPIDPAPWQTGGGASFRFYKLAAPGPGGAIAAEKSGRAFVDPSTGLILYFAPDEPIQSESFYRAVFTGIRDMQGNALAEQTFHFFSFDQTKPFVHLLSPVPSGFPLISGLEYFLNIDARNGTADGTPATDVAFVDYFRVDGAAETYVTTIRSAPFAYRFVAPEAPEGGLTYSLRARATDGSGNVGDPATMSWTVKPNAAPKNVAITLTPASAYPANSIVAAVAFEDEGTFATVNVVATGVRFGGGAYSETQTKQLTRATVADPWPAAQVTFKLPADLNPGTPINVAATVTDVRGLSTQATATLPLLTDAGNPTIISVAPAAETIYRLNDRFTAEAVVTDPETAVAEVAFTIDGQTYRVPAGAPGVVDGPLPGSKKFSSPQITVPAKNVDTRVAIVVVAKDYQGNTASRAFEVIYTGVNDPAVPKGAWLCPVDRAVLPAAQTFTLPLRVRATDDISVTSVKLRVPGLADPLVAAQVGSTDEYATTATVTTPAAGSDFVVTAIISDADAAHTIELPIVVDLVAIDQTIDATQAITSGNIAQFENKNLLVRSAAGRLVTHLPLTVHNLLVLDGGRIETLGTTMAIEQKVDLTVVDRLYIDCSSSIDVTAKGYLGGWGVNPDGSNARNESASGMTVGNATAGGPTNSGASHGGLGAALSGGVANAPYDPLIDPSRLGTGGAGTSTCCTPGGTGGGAVSLRTATQSEAIGRIVIAGTIRADGGTGFRGGSGGSVRINGRQVIVGPAARVTVNGADQSDGAGGGGRVAVSAAERLDVAATQFEARGGSGAGAGTIYVRRPGTTEGELYIGSSSGSRQPRSTPLGYVGTGTATAVASNTITDSARTFDVAVVGEDVLFDSDPAKSYTVIGISPDRHSLHTDPADGEIGASAGAAYRGLIRATRIEVSANSLARFDQSFAVVNTIDDASAVVRNSGAVVVRYSDRPSVSVNTTPAAGANVIRGTNLELTYDAASGAGISKTSVEFSAVAPLTDVPANYPATVTARRVTIAVPPGATLGPATLNVRVTDRADRYTDAPVAAFTVLENQSPSIDAFTTIPDSLYPGRIVAVSVNAADDVAVTRLSIASQIGANPPATQTFTPNTKVATQNLSITVPIATPGGTAMTIEAAAEDGYPGHTPTKQTKNITILTDTAPPSVAINQPASNQLFQEAAGAVIPVRVTASDADVAVKTVTVTVGDAPAAPLSLIGNVWSADVPVPTVDTGSDVPFAVVVTASDYQGNVATATVSILVRPLVDENAPLLAWTCGTNGAMYPTGYAATLRVMAKASPSMPSNGVNRVEFFANGSTTPILATPVTGLPDHYEALYTFPDLVEGTLIPIRAVATSLSGASSDVTTRVAVVAAPFVTVTADTTLDASNSATFAGKTVVVQSGTLNVVGSHTFDRLLVLRGATVSHPASPSNKLNITTTRGAFIACGGAIDVTGRGFAASQTYTPPAAGNATGGSHLGLGGLWDAPQATTYGSVYQPQEAGGGGGHSTEGRPGGGVIRLNATSIMNEGAIRANGTNAPGYSSGAGGSIWITTGRIAGPGSIEANGGLAHYGGGGGGAIAIEYSDATSILTSTAAKSSTSAQNRIGGAGTVYIKGPASTYGELVVDNGGLNGQNTVLPALGQGVASTPSNGTIAFTAPAYFVGHWVEVRTSSGVLKGTWRIGSVTATNFTLVPNGPETISIEAGDRWQGVYRFDTLRTPNGDPLRSADPIRLGANGVVNLSGPTVAGKYLEIAHPVSATNVTVAGNVSVPSIDATNLTVRSGGTLTPSRIAPNTQTITLNVTGALTIESGGSIDATGRGFAASQTYTAPAAGNATGGSHIGLGGLWDPPQANTYGSVYRPQEAGGGGGHSTEGRPGGGVVRIVASNIANEGAIRANGMSAPGYSSGAGGSIWITTGRIAGAGAIEANGGAAHYGGGGGGAIAIEYTDATSVIASATAKALTSAQNRIGGAGTVYVKGPSSTYGELTIHNGGLSGQNTVLPALGGGVVSTASSGTIAFANPPSYFVGHWVEVIAAAGQLKGTWRIGSVTATSFTLTPNGAETISIEAGDRWQGVYRFDNLFLPNGDPVRSADPIRLGVNGVVTLSGPTVSGKYLELSNPISGTSVTVTGNVSLPSIETTELTIRSGATLTPSRIAPNTQALSLTAVGTLTIESTASIDATGRGFAANQTYAPPAAGNATGGSHLGIGGLWDSPQASTFGSVHQPQEAGGGGGNASEGRPGGGVIRIDASAIVNAGAIRANGMSAPGYSSGAGGSIWITTGRISGAGSIEANGGAAHYGSGGGGALSITYTDATSALSSVSATSSTSVQNRIGGAGTIYVRGPAATHGSLTIDNGTLTGQNTQLPALGSGVAQPGSSGATLITDRAANIPSYFIGHWVEITSKGTWRIQSISGKTVVLQPNGTETIVIDAGDRWRGIYRFDSLKLRRSRLVSEDRLDLGAPADLDGTSSIVGNNAAPPSIDITKVSLQSSAAGFAVVGIVGAVSDPDQPVLMIATNVRTGQTSTSPAAANGVFSVPVQGNAGDSFTIKARDANVFPLESTPIAVPGTLPSDTPVATQLSKNAWTSETNFKPQLVAVSGTILAVASSVLNGGSSDKIAVFDISDPARPSFLRTVAGGWGAIRDLKLIGGWAYVAANVITTIDLRVANAPRNLGSDRCGDEPAIAVAGGYAFTSDDCTQDGSIHITDVTNPAAPRFQATFSRLATPLPNGTNHIFKDLIAYGSAYLIGISDSSSGKDIVVIDRRDITNFRKAGELSIPNFAARRGRMKGSMLYLVSATEAELVAVDFSNPTAPAVVARGPLPSPGGNLLPVEGSILVADGASGLVTTGYEPALTVTGSAATTGIAHDVAVSGQYAYVANELGIAVVPVSIPPVIDASLIASSYSGGMITVTGSARSITGHGAIDVEVRLITSQGVPAAGMTVALQIDGSFSVSVPSSPGEVITVKATDVLSRVAGPVTIGTVPFGSSSALIPIVVPNDNFRARTVKTEGNLVVVSSYPTSNGVSDKLVVYDMTNPASPVQRVLTGGWGAIRDFEVLNGVAYIAGNVLTTMDLRQPNPTRNLGSDRCGDEPSVAVASGYAFTADDCTQNGSIHVTDVTNPIAPRFMATFSGLANPMAAGTQHIFSDLITLGTDFIIGISGSSSGKDIVVMDRRDITKIIKAGELSIDNFTAFRGKLVGSALYIAGTNGSWAVVDMSAPRTPRLVSITQSAGTPHGIEVSGAAVITADRGTGVSFFDLSSTPPRQSGVQFVGGDAWDVALGGTNLYVANDQGLVIISDVVAPPQIRTNFISVASTGVVTGTAGAITGRAPLRVTVANITTGQSVVADVNGDGSFVAPTGATAGQTITVRASDALLKTAGPVVVGTVPFGTSTTVLPIIIPNDNFRARTVKVEGNLVAVSSYPTTTGVSDKLVVYDMTNPAAPVQKVVTAGWGAIRDFELINGIAYIAGNLLTTVDVRLANPVRNLSSDRCGDEPAVAVSGGYAFTSDDCTQNGSVHIHDVADPATPRFMATASGLATPLPGGTNHVFSDLLALGNDFLIGISGSTSGKDVIVIDRRDVNALRKAGELSIDGFTSLRARLIDSTLYIASTDGAWAAVDVSTPSTPALISVTQSAGLSHGIEVSGAVVMTADRGTGVTFFDRSSTPIRQTGVHVVGGDAWDVALGGSSLYVANDQGLVIVSNVAAPPDIDPRAITVTSSSGGTATVSGANFSIGGQAAVQVAITSGAATLGETPVSSAGAFAVNVPAVSGQRLSVTARDGGGKTSAHSIGAVPFATAVSNTRGTLDNDNLRARRVLVDGTTTLVSDGILSGQRLLGSDKAFLFKQPDASAPPVITTVTPGWGEILDAVIRAGYAWFGGHRLTSFSYGDAVPTRYLTDSDRCGREYSVAFIGNNAFTAEGECNNTGVIHIYDATTPTAVRFLREQATVGSGGVSYRKLLAYGSYLVAITPDGNRDVTIIDASNINALVTVAALDVPNFAASNGVLDGSTLYLAGADAGVAIVDLANPAAPVWRSTIDTPGLARSIAVSGANEIVVADGSPGLTFINTSNKQAPLILGSQPLQGNAADVKVVGSQIYAATETRFYVLRRP